MPAITRSAARRKGIRSPFEYRTPSSSVKPSKLTALKRKFAVCGEEFDNDEPTRKKYLTRSKSAIKEKFPSTCPNSKCMESTTQHLDNQKISTQHLIASRIPQRCIRRSSVRNPITPVRTGDMRGTSTKKNNKGKENRSFNVNGMIANKPNNTPAYGDENDSVAARIKTYSAFRRSKQKRSKGRNNEMNDKLASPTLGQRWQESKENCVNHRRNKCNDCCDEEQEKDLKSYKEKYLDMISRMKTLQEKLLKAQQNTLKSCKVSNAYINQLQISLEKEIQNVSIARKDCQKREEEIEKLKSTLAHQEDNKGLDEALDYSFDSEKTDGLQKKLKEQQAILNFYSVLTGISVARDESHLTNSNLESFRCECLPESSGKHAVRFRLMYDKEMDEFEYSPNARSPGSEHLMNKLPDYLQENIFFLPTQAPRFLSRLLKNVEKM